MTEQEQKQLNDTEAHFNHILPYHLPKSRNTWKVINTNTTLGTLKPLATVMVHKNDSYIIKVMEGFRVFSKLQEAETAQTGDFDLTLAVKRGTNLISFSKSKEGEKEWYCMYCIPLNDREMMDKIMKDIQKQGNTALLLLIKSDLDNFAL